MGSNYVHLLAEGPFTFCLSASTQREMRAF